MSLSLTRRRGSVFLACLAAVSSVRAQDEAARSPEAPAPRQSGVSDPAARGDPSPKEKAVSPPDELFASLGVRFPPDVLALAEIGRRMRLSVERMPNYTCLETIRRERAAAGGRQASAPRPISSDRVRVDVAFVDGTKLYSWPRAERFEETPLTELVGFGMLSTGDFASTARTLFLDRNGLFSYVGEVDFEGGRALRWNFRVPLFRSGFSIDHETGEVTVDFSGSIWADRVTKDLLRIETQVIDAPPPLLVSRVINQVDYERISIGGQEFQLPKRAHLGTHYPAGERNHNWIEFSNCREFGARSELSFAESLDETAATSPSATEEFSLPAGLSVRLRLVDGIDSATSAAGDEVRATVRRAVEHDGKIVLPKGAVVVGRLRRVERFFEPYKHAVIGLAFHRVEFAGKWARFNATITKIGKIPGLTGAFGGSGEPITIPTAPGPAPPNIERRTSFGATPLSGTLELDIRGRRIRISAGHGMIWTTRDQ